MSLQLWTNAEYRNKQPMPLRPDAHSDGFTDESIPQTQIKSQALSKSTAHNKSFCNLIFFRYRASCKSPNPPSNLSFLKVLKAR